MWGGWKELGVHVSIMDVMSRGCELGKTEWSFYFIVRRIIIKVINLRCWVGAVVL